jgi:hypothetical protein
MPALLSVMRPDGFHGSAWLPAARRRAGVGRAGARGRGARSARSYFEGWYVKLVSADRDLRLAAIPGMFVAEDGSAHAFVQVLDGTTGRTAYHRFDLGEFAARADRFDVRVGANRFSTDGIEVDLPGLAADVRFGPLNPWPVTLREPGAMGWYAWVPTMECYHGVVSLDHALAGRLVLDGREVDLSGGRGYLEKDWGTAFPAAYVWMQSNHFEQPGVSLVASTALIPWRGSRFRGDLVGVRVPGRPLQRFTSYTGARTVSLAVDDRHVDWVLAAPDGARVELHASIAGGATGLLHAPVRTQMHQRVAETLDGTIDMRLADGSGRTRLSAAGDCAGVEVHGDLEALLATHGRAG